MPVPGDLSDGVLALELREFTASDPERGWVTAYHFVIRHSESNQPVGLISLRVGSNDSLRLYAGHVGYAIAEPFPGNRFASRAVWLMLPLTRIVDLDPLWITCDPTNAASRRTCEIIGTEYQEDVLVPESHERYLNGARVRSRYRLSLASHAV